MKGHWRGNFTGTNTGSIILEIDEMDDHFDGAVYAYDANPEMPSVAMRVKTKDKSFKFDLTAPVEPLDRQNGEPTSWFSFYNGAADAEFPTTIKTSWLVAGDKITVEWVTNIGTTGHAELRRDRADLPSAIIPELLTWEEFKNFATAQKPYCFIYRGQEVNSWRLRTHFHRSGRAHILRFIREDIPALHRVLTTMTPHFYRLDNNQENASFYSLVQHHGYPTPLLDWTHSPFVAAYFAYKGLKKNAVHPTGQVRILMFDAIGWSGDFRQFPKISPAPAHFSLLEPIALNNSRMLPQQALTSVTNLDDIESHVASCSSQADKVYLKAIDLPASDRGKVMRELELMGITAGSLFPGIDGACEQMKERYFDL